MMPLFASPRSRSEALNHFGPAASAFNGWRLKKSERLIQGEINIWLNNTKRNQTTLKQEWLRAVDLGSYFRATLGQLVPREIKRGPNKGKHKLDFYSRDGSLLFGTLRGEPESLQVKEVLQLIAHGFIPLGQALLLDAYTNPSAGVRVSVLMPDLRL